jgi:hypothetical protein
MTEQQKSIFPPFDLVQKWMYELHFCVPHPDYGKMNAQPHWLELVEKVAQYAADAGVEACVAWLADPSNNGLGDDLARRLAEKLRNACRPKPPSLADEALIHFESYASTFETAGGDSDLVLRALQQLKDHQKNTK